MLQRDFAIIGALGDWLADERESLHLLTVQSARDLAALILGEAYPAQKVALFEGCHVRSVRWAVPYRQQLLRRNHVVNLHFPSKRRDWPGVRRVQRLQLKGWGAPAAAGRLAV